MEMPFDIIINSVQCRESLSFTKSELLFFAAPDAIPEGPGISGKMELDPRCGIKSASGVFKIKRVWTKPNPDVDGEFVELFEGFMSFKVSYGALYRRNGHGNGNNIKFAFWGVRARKDNDGKEIGLYPMIPVSVSSEQVGDDLRFETFLLLIFLLRSISPMPPPSEIHLVLAVRAKKDGKEIGLGAISVVIRVVI